MELVVVLAILALTAAVVAPGVARTVDGVRARAEVARTVDGVRARAEVGAVAAFLRSRANRR